MSVEDHAPSWIALDAAVNARAVVPGVLLRADNLQSLSAPDVARADRGGGGLEVVVDLRTNVEVALEGPGPLTAEVAVRIEHRSLYPDSGGNTDRDADTAELEGDDPQQHAPLRRTMERVLALVEERFGGSAAWLSAHGLSEPDLGRLRRRLAPPARTPG